MIEDNLGPEDEELNPRFDNYEQEKIFRATLYDVVNDSWWCYRHGINYVNPDIKAAANLLYSESFSKRDRVV